MKLSYGLFMAEAESCPELIPRAERLSNVATIIRGIPRSSITEQEFREVCKKNKIDPASITNDEFRLLLDIIQN